MDRLRIRGRKKLRGQVSVSGAKNASLPAMAASLLTPERVALGNVPDVWDVGTMRRLLADLGTEVRQPSAHDLELSSQEITSHEAPYERVKTMRASVLVLGPLLARYGKARVSLPGGCAIGARPIDLHIEALKKLGAHITLEHGFVEAETDGLRGTTLRFDHVTVGGTENAMMAATLARGETVIENAACEPEILDLAELLIEMGAQIEGAGTSDIRVAGVDRLHGATHVVVPDRIEAGTYLVAGALTGDPIEVTGLRPEHLEAVERVLVRAGVSVEVDGDSIRVARPEAPLRTLVVTTDPYPGFPTDMQAQLMVLLTQADGDSAIAETIFENRFMHVAELSRMGANIELDGRHAVVHGPTSLSGAKVMATDLRASACLVLAALAAEGETVIDRVYHLDRGYERLEEKLAGLGADVERLR